MTPKRCGNCGTVVLPKQDGTCPSCLQPFIEAAPSKGPVTGGDEQRRMAPSSMSPPIGERAGKPIAAYLAAIYAVALAVPVPVGLFFFPAADRPGNAVRMPVAAVIIAAVLVVAGIGLVLRRGFARHLFLVVAPWGSLALASAFPQQLWRADLPYTILLVVVYAPLCFLLARGSALRSFGARGAGWTARGGALVFGCASMMLILRTMVEWVSPGKGLFATNVLVQWLVLCDMPFWHYFGALLAVSIPTRGGPTRR